MIIFVRVLWGNEKTAEGASVAQGPSGTPRAEGSKIWGTGENKLCNLRQVLLGFVRSAISVKDQKLTIFLSKSRLQLLS